MEGFYLDGRTESGTSVLECAIGVTGNLDEKQIISVRVVVIGSE